MENDGFNNDAIKSPRSGSELSEVASLWHSRKNDDYQPQKSKHRFVSRSEIEANSYDLCERVYLSGYTYPEDIPLRYLDELFDIQRGSFGASLADDGEFPFITTSEEPKRHSQWTFDSEAICIPVVSATGHGHASIKRIHYVNGKFGAATITAVMTPKSGVDIYVPYVYYYLLSHKDELLVPLMRGSANVSLSEQRLGRLRIPVPLQISSQKNLVQPLVDARRRVDGLKNDLSQADKEFAVQFDAMRRAF